MSFKSGFVVLIGRSNVGKSTLLNSLVGTKVAITTPKPQTTRHVIQGIVHDERGQIVFVDTPGIFEKTKNALSAKLTKKAKEALKEIDLVLYVVDPTRGIGNEERIILSLLKQTKAPKVLVINKIDLPPFDTAQGAPRLAHLEEYQAIKGDFNESIEISALRKRHLKPLLDLIFKYLPEGERYYPEYQFTNIRQKFWLEELIREKVFLVTSQEVPYGTTVKIEETDERPDGTFYVKAMIITSEPRHRAMLIGRGGRKIKEIGQMARKELEQAMDKKVFLDLEVKVEKEWQKRFT